VEKGLAKVVMGARSICFVMCECECLQVMKVAEVQALVGFSLCRG
jgi:hypothetical protein